MQTLDYGAECGNVWLSSKECVNMICIDGIDFYTLHLLCSCYK